MGLIGWNAPNGIQGHSASKQLHALNLLKVIAIMLVFNSHCENLYPVSAMATGGALGNALFFIISGYLVKVGNEQFGHWIKRRVIQLYPAMFIVSVIYMISFHYYPNNIMTVLERFVWPTGYWFIGGLLLFSVLLYICEKTGVYNHFYALSVVLCLLYFVTYIVFIDKTVWSVEDHGAFRLIYYFFLFSFGYCLKLPV